MSNKKVPLEFLFVFLAIDLIWLKSSLGKWMGGVFINSLGGILTKFASQNPYPWYKEFLKSVAIPNSSLFGTLILLGETFVAFSLLFGLYFLISKRVNTGIVWLVTLGLITGTLLNANFWLASGWTGASTDSLNLLMFLIEVIGVWYFITFLRKGLR